MDYKWMYTLPPAFGAIGMYKSGELTSGIIITAVLLSVTYVGNIMENIQDSTLNRKW